MKKQRTLPHHRIIEQEIQYPIFEKGCLLQGTFFLHFSQVPNKREGVLTNRRVGKFRNLINGAKINGGKWEFEKKALNDYTRTERTETGCHRA